MDILTCSLHHYFPALYFAILLKAFLLDHLGSKLGPKGHLALIVLVGCITVGVFFYFAPFAFGFEGPASALKGRQWLQSWNIY